MPVALHTLPLTEPVLPAVACWLLAQKRALACEDFASFLVLLPSQRACGQLAHALLEAAGVSALILPRIMTPARLVDRLIGLGGAADAEPLPHPALRPLLLAPRLAGLDWLRERPEAAPGLAQELVALFDEVRLARQDALVLQGADDEALLRHVESGAEDILLADLRRIRAAWRVYREALPEDPIDRQRVALDRARDGWPGEAPVMIAAAHLGRLDRVLVDLLQGLAATGVPVHWLTAAADDPRSRLLLATYRDSERIAHPLYGIRDLAASVGAAPPPAPAFAATDLSGRLASLSEARRQLAPDGPVQLLACNDPEHESRVVADRVCRTLVDAHAAGAAAPAILIATPDRALAARIAAQLRDAGVDVDDTRGRSLATLPAGRLLRDILRTVTAGWPFAPLLEVLTHPYVRLTAPGARPDHAVRVQLLEAALRRAQSARRGLPALLAIAAADDGEAGPARQGWSLQALVGDLAERLAPLSSLAAAPVAWRDAVAAVVAVWETIAPDRPLAGEPDPRGDLDDIGALAVLLDTLAQAAPWLPAAPLSEIAAAISALLADPVSEVRPQRSRFLPVRLVGLVEARLETADLLVLAGLSQDVFPGRLPRPLFLADRLRRHLGLEHRRANAGRDAELFLRLLHAAPRVVVTWPRERDGRPALPSPLVRRLALAVPVAAAPPAPAIAREPLLRRRALPAGDDLARAEAAYRAEPEPIPAPRVPPPDRLSHSAMQHYRDCPYRYLLANALRLRRPDPVEAAVTSAAVGNLAHAVMQRWLAVDGPGWAAVAGGDRAAAAASFQDAVAAVQAEQARDLPGSAVALRVLLAAAPDLVDYELTRAAVWLPAAVEARFEITLAQAAQWLAANGVASEPSRAAPAFAATHGGFVLSGVIDRIDRCRNDASLAAVIDYKTGWLPSRAQVRDGRELQVYLYALAVETGGVDSLAAPPAGAWRVDHGGFYGLRRGGLGLPAQPHLAAREDLVAGIDRILAQARAILDPAVPFALVPDWQEADGTGRLPCRTCEFRGICRVEERDTSPHLAARVAALLTESPRRLP